MQCVRSAFTLPERLSSSVSEFHVVVSEAYCTWKPKSSAASLWFEAGGAHELILGSATTLRGTMCHAWQFGQSAASTVSSASLYV